MLANERTFLAWLRTALALLGGALAVRALDLDLARRESAAVGGLLCAAAVTMIWLGWSGWRRNEDALRHGEPLPVAGRIAGLAAVVVLLAIGVGWIVVS